jgi:cell division septation protein DedD
MSRPESPIGTCPACDRDNVKLYKSAHIEDGTRICKACANAAGNAARAEARKAGVEEPKKPSGAPKLEKSPKAPTPPPAVKPRPTPAPRPTLPTAIDTGHSSGRAVVMRITCHEYADVVRVLAATAGLSCHVGLEGEG